MKRLFRTITTNNKQSKSRDFISESLNLAKPTENQDTQISEGHASHYYYNSSEMLEQEQPFELEARKESNASNKNEDPNRESKLSFGRQEVSNSRNQNDTSLEDPILVNQPAQNTFSLRLKQPFSSFNHRGFYSKGNQHDHAASDRDSSHHENSWARGNQSPDDFNHQGQFKRKSNKFSMGRQNWMERKAQHELPQDRTSGEHEAGEESGSRNPFSKGFGQQSFNHLPRAYDVDLSISIKPCDLSVGSPFDYGYTRIYDASHDGTKKEVFEDGAIRINYDGDFLNDNRLDFSDIFGWSWGPFSTMKIGSVEAQVNAIHSTTGENVDLGAYTLDLSEDRFLVDLNGKIEASESFLDRRSSWDFDVDIDAVFGGVRQNIEDFDETLTMIDALDWGTFDGDIEANTFNYYNMDILGWVGSEYDSGRIYKARGGTDELILNGIDSADIKSFNGETFSGLTDYTTIGEQAIYQGTAFDILSLKNGDEIYLQGFERITTEDDSYRIREGMSDSTKEQWNLNAMDAASAWRFNKGSDKVKLVSLDTGLNDVAGSVTDAHDEISHVQNKSTKSNNSHGHRAMSVMGAKHDSENLAGIAPGSQLVAYNVWSDTFYESIEDAKDQRNCDERLVFQNAAWLTNPSSNWPSAEAMKTSFEETQEYAFFSIAAGNDWNKDTVWAAGQQPDDLIPDDTTELDNIAIVGALKFTGTEEIDAITGGSITNVTGTELAGYSNAGDGMTMVAPTDSQSIDANGTVSSFGGTSCASPNLAGAAALVWSENLALTGVEVKDIITTSAMDLGDPGTDDSYGAGTVNIDSAVRRAHALSADHELASLYSNTDFLA
ncbi:Minor extracellular protease Epr precursor [Prochlorococcus marinus str. MIT 1313]|uniref:S8 family peptidase n=1 Tax=Prochlorococcus TaxID=1218 RepID=UPI0007B388D2|nr:S8 family serine peptidase [Prochlorococcus marinus]KZR70276.1 Minor extracellular protease Epr precursor [Prochlorococcus marinus str. MIT 1313]KZR70748.1 Minor extracellular protease Epr precursor [Prochlorococcus marinus str. MIT 1318]